MQSMILDLKMVYSTEIIEQIPEERRQYFFNLVNSIPDDILETKNIVSAIKNGTKLKSFLGCLNYELKVEGMDMKKLKEELEKFNARYKKALGVPTWAIKKGLVEI